MSKFFTTNDMDNLIFFQVPKVLIIGEKYRSMKPTTKMVYILLLDRVKLSMENNWIDDGKYYVRLSQTGAQELLGLSESTYKRCKKELKEYDLLEEKQEGLTKANKLFPKKLEYTEADIYRANHSANDAIISDVERAKSIDENSMKIPKSKEPLKGQIEPTGENQLKGQIEPSLKGQIEPIDGSKRTPINNNFNNNNYIKNKYIVNNVVNKDEIINNLFLEYTEKGLSEDVCFMVLREVEEKSDVANFGGYLRTCLENTLYKHNLKHGLINNEEKFGSISQSKKVPFYNWLEER